MCYPVGYWQSGYNSASRVGQVVVPLAAAADEVAREPPRINTGGGLAEGGGAGGNTIKVCLCSPTSHPGSFRCRQHRGEYQWVSRLRPKPSLSVHSS